MQRGLDYAVMFLAGALVGGVAAALTTPISGRRARRIIRKKVEDGTHQLEQGLERGSRQVRDGWAKVASMAR